MTWGVALMLTKEGRIVTAKAKPKAADWRAEMLDRMRRASDARAASSEGVAISAEIARALQNSVQGINVIPPLGRFDLGLALLDALA